MEEVRLKQPKVYKQWQERPETIEPPEGEMLAAAAERATEAIEKLARKHRSGTIAVVIPEPLASLVQHRFQGKEWSDLWQTANGCSRIEAMTLDKDFKPVAVTADNVTVNGKSSEGKAEEKDVAGSVENRIHGPATTKVNGLHPTMVYRGAKVRPQ